MIIDLGISKLHTELSNIIIAVYLYGSTARNEADDNSDCDILICVKDCSDEDYFKLKDCIEQINKDKNYEFSIYQLSTLYSMWQKGSYFLWHIKKEGKILYCKSNEVSELLDTLPRYKNTYEDFKEYRQILDDIKIAISEDCTWIYELSLLATLARNICIGICYLINEMDFGRITPIVKSQKFFGDKFPFSVDEYKCLYMFRLNMARKVPLKNVDINKTYINDWCCKIQKLLNLSMTIRSI